MGKLLRSSQDQDQLERISITSLICKQGLRAGARWKVFGGKASSTENSRHINATSLDNFYLESECVNTESHRASCLGRAIKTIVFSCSGAVIHRGHPSCCEEGIAASI